MDKKKDTKNEKDNRSFIGIVFLVIGIYFLERNFNFMPDHISYILFSWQMLMIAIGIILIVAKKRNIGGLFMIGIGSVFLWDRIYPFSPVDRQIAIPAIFIFVGLALIIGYLNNSKNKAERKKIKKQTEPKKKKSKYDDIEFDIDKIEPIED